MTDPIEKPVLKPRWASLRDAMEDLRECVAVMRPGMSLPLSRESAHELAELIDGALKMVADVLGHDADVVKLRTVDVAGLTGHHDQHACLHVFDVGSRVKHILFGTGEVVGYDTATLAHAHIAKPGTLLWKVRLDNGTYLRAPATKLENIETDIAERKADLSITSDLTGGSRVFVPEHGRFYPEHPVEVRPEGTFYDSVQLSSISEEIASARSYKLSDFPGLVGMPDMGAKEGHRSDLGGSPVLCHVAYGFRAAPEQMNIEPGGLGLHPDRHDTGYRFQTPHIPKIGASNSVSATPSEDWIRPGVFCTHKGERGLIIWKGGSTLVEVQMEADDTRRIVQSSDVTPLKAPKPNRMPPTSESGVHDNSIVRAVVADLEGGDKSLIGAAFQRWADRDF